MARDRLVRLNGGLRVKTIAVRVKTTDVRVKTIVARVRMIAARVMTPVVLPVPRPRRAQRFRPPEPKHLRRVQRLRFPELKHLRPELKHRRCVPKLLLHERKRQPRARKVLFSAPKDRVAGATAVMLVRIVVLAMTGDQVVTRTGGVVMTGVRVAMMVVVVMEIGTEAVDLVVMSRVSAALSPLRCQPQSGRRKARRPISSTPMTAASSGRPGLILAPRPPSRAMRPRPNPPSVWARCPLRMTVAIVARAARCVTAARQAPVRFACTSTSVAATT